MIYAVIVACEIGFWVVILAGLAARYLLRRRRLGAVLLAGVPLVDLILLAAAVIDLRRGGHAEIVHGLAAVYLGVSLAWGHHMIRWADARFAHRFAGGPPPQPPPKIGQAHARHERVGWLRHLLAWAIGCSLLLGGILYVGDAARTEAFASLAKGWTLVLLIDFVWSFSYTLWPKREAVVGSR